MKKLFLFFISCALFFAAQAQLGKPIFRLNTPMHTQSIYRISTDVAAKYSLTVSADKTAKLWDNKTGNLLRTFRPPIGQGNEGTLYAGSLSPDGKIAAVSGLTSKYGVNNNIYLFDTATGKLLQRLGGIETTVLDLEFSADGMYLAAALNKGKGINIYKRLGSSGFSKLKNLSGYTDQALDIAFDRSGRLVTVCYDSKVRLYNKKFELLKQIDRHGGKVFSVAFSADGEKVAVAYRNSRTIDVFSGKTLEFLYKPVLDGLNKRCLFYALAFSSYDNSLYAGGSSSDIQKGEVRFTIRKWANEGQGAYIDKHIAKNAVLKINALPDGRIVFAGNYPEWGKLDKNLKLIYYKTAEINAFTNSQYLHFKINSTGDKVIFKPSSQNAIQFSVNDRKLSAFRESPKFKLYNDKKAGVTVSGWQNAYFPKINGNAIPFFGKKEKFRCTDVSSDGKNIAFGSTWNIYSLSPAGKLLWKLGRPQVWSVNISKSNKIVVASHDGGIISWYRNDLDTKELSFTINLISKGSIAEKGGLKKGDIISSVNGKKFVSQEHFLAFLKEKRRYNFSIKRNNRNLTIPIDKTGDRFGFGFDTDAESRLLLTLYSHPDGKRWLLYTPDGYFDCSPGAEDLAGWHINRGQDQAALFYPLSRFYEQYYTPNLGARVLGGEQIGTKENINNFKLPPLVEITSPERETKMDNKRVSVRVKVTDQGGGIDEIRLYLNGKLLEASQRGFAPVGENKAVKIRTFDISLSTGENRIQASAFNKQRIESIADEITVFYAGAKKTANLYMLVIGINNYKNPRYKLNYALADAQAFKQAIEKGSQSIFGSVNITFLNDAEATRPQIFQAFSKIKTTAKAEDVFIFYYAGHGVMSEEDKAQFYLIPYDVTQLYGNNEMLKSKAISAGELQQFSTKLKAQKQLFVFDACQSGGLTDLLASRGAAEEKAIAQLARSTGTYWLTASNSEQFATEFTELGHGVFTYAILQGLKGEADGGKRDKKVTVKELSAFLNDKVPELSEKHKGQAQYPTSYGYGQDFPIIIVK